MRKPHKIALACVAVVLCGVIGILSALYWAMFGDRSMYAEHLTTFQGLPSTASDITVYTNKNITGIVVADFAISEADFVAWARECQWNVAEIDTPIQMFSPQAYHQGDPSRGTTVERGLYATYRRANGGGLEVAFDRANQRGRIARGSR